MTRYFVEEGRSVPVTVMRVGPCVVIQKKTLEKDGYAAVQLGFVQKRESRVNRPLKGHFRAAGSGCYQYLREIRVDDVEGFQLGQVLTSEVFAPGDTVNVKGVNKGRGFAGVMKRWGFGGGRDTHGCRSHRVPGSIGSSALPARVRKGQRMPGRKGGESVTVKNLRVVDVRPDMDVVLLLGSVPGGKNWMLVLSKVSA